MATGPSEIYIFGKNRVNVRQLVFFDCLLKESDCAIEVLRVVRQPWGLETRASVVDANVSTSTNSVHLHEIFVSPKVGLMLRFEQTINTFAVQEPSSSDSLVSFSSAAGHEFSMKCFVQANEYK